MEKEHSLIMGLLVSMEFSIMRWLKKTLFFILFLFIGLIACSQDLSGTYLYDLNHRWKFETISIQKVNDNYLFLYDSPTSDGIDAYSAFEIGSWDGEQIVFDNGYTIYALRPQPDGSLHYYAIKDENEFPGKDFRPITEEDLKKIAELK